MAELGFVGLRVMGSRMASNGMLTAARAMHLDRQDFAVMFEVLARMAGAGGHA